MCSSPPSALTAALLTLACLGCSGQLDAGVATDDTAAGLRNFSWIVEGRLAGLGRPGAERALDQDLAALQQLGIVGLVSLTETPTPAEVAAIYGIEVISIPIVDFTPPTQPQLDEGVAYVRGALAADRPVAIHCAAGLGRTGTVLAAYLVSEGRTADAAIAEIRALRPGSIETDEQEAAVREFELRWNGRAGAGAVPPIAPGGTDR